MDNDTKLLEEAYTLVLERDIKRTGKKSVNNKDVSNFLYKITDGGREIFTIHTIRKNDSTSNPKKRAGNPMKITGKLGACKASIDNATFKRPDLSTPNQYKKNSVLRMCVSAVDGRDYTKKYAPQNRTRSFDVTTITKIEARGETYDVV